MSGSDQASEKTEEATEHKKRDARERGQVAQSKDLTTLTAISVLMGTLVITHQTMAKNLANNYLLELQLIASSGDKSNSFIPQVWGLITHNIELLFIPIILAAVVSLFVNVLQLGGIKFAKEVFKLKFDKFNPISNFKQIFSLKNFVKFLKNILTITVLVIIAFVIFNDEIGDIMLITNYSFVNIVSFLGYCLIKIFVWLLFSYFIFALVDWYWERFNLAKQLRMTKDEVKKESKNNDGDPEIKGRRRELHQEIIAEDGMQSSLKDATLVLANPTHIAIVILYSPKRWPLPIVIIKASDRMAQIIFATAKKYEIPVVRDKWLARQLYEYADVGKYIPKSMLENVADVINQNLYRLPKVIAELQAVKKASSNTTI